MIISCMVRMESMYRQKICLMKLILKNLTWLYYLEVCRGTLNLKEHDGVRYVVKQYAKEGRFVGAICAAPTILKSLGLLEGRRATCIRV